MGMEMRPLNEGTGPVQVVTIDRHLYLTEDGSRVVPEGSADARWLWASPGDEKPRDEAERLGAVQPAEADDDAQADAAEGEDTKGASAPEDKRRSRPADKGR